MRVLILGATGMLGHKLYQLLSRHHDVYGTVRGDMSTIEKYRIFNRDNVIQNVDAYDQHAVQQVIRSIHPDVVINCIGIIKQVEEAKNYISAISINALFPHLVAEFTASLGIRFIQISTDCVFSGKKGNYLETDVSDAEDLYGRSKFLGEVKQKNTLTLRTSIIGRELSRSVSLLDWFLSQKGRTVNGYTHAIYSGLTTIALVAEINRLLTEFPALTGLYHVSSDPISKYDLLGIVNEQFNLGVDLVPQPSFRCDRSLNSEAYRLQTRFSPLPWATMIKELFDDTTEYEN